MRLPAQRPLPIKEEASLLTGVLTAASWTPPGCLLDARPPPSQFRSSSRLSHGYAAPFTAWAKMSAAAASAERITWAYTRSVIAGSAWPSRGGDDIDGDAREQQRRGVDMPKVV